MIITEFRFRIVLSPMHMYLCNVMLWIAVRPMYVLVKHAMLGAEMVFDEVPITCLLGRTLDMKLTPPTPLHSKVNRLTERLSLYSFY